MRKYIPFQSAIVLFLLVTSCSANSALEENEFLLKANFKAVYTMQLSKSENEPILYYLIEIKIINTSKSSQKFLTMTCSTTDNLVFNRNDITVLENNCANNSLITITLSPDEEFSCLALINSSENSIESLKVGWILLDYQRSKDQFNYFKVLEESRLNKNNIIWSDSIPLTPAGGFPFEIGKKTPELNPLLN